MTVVFDALAMVLMAYVLGFLFYGFYRQLSARVHRRWGPPIIQNFIDNVKLLAKKEAVSHGAMFYFGPLIMAAGSVTTLLFVPFLYGSDWLQGFSADGNLILVMYLMLMGPLGNALAVGAGGNPFGVMGVTRGLTRLIGIETPFFLGLALVMLQYGTTSIHGIMEAQAQSGTWTLLSNPLAFAILFLPLVGSMGSSPFDVVAAPVEVYSGPRAEFGGKFLGLLLTQNMIFSIAKLVLMVDLFLGGAGSIPELIAKGFGLFVAIIIVGMVFGRFKTEQAVDFYFKFPLALGAVAVAVTLWI